MEPNNETLTICGIDFYRTNPYDGNEYAVWAAYDSGLHFTMTTSKDRNLRLYRIEAALAWAGAGGGSFAFEAVSGYRPGPEDALKEVVDGLQSVQNRAGHALTQLTGGIK